MSSDTNMSDGGCRGCERLEEQVEQLQAKAKRLDAVTEFLEVRFMLGVNGLGWISRGPRNKLAKQIYKIAKGESDE